MKTEVSVFSGKMWKEGKKRMGIERAIFGDCNKKFVASGNKRSAEKAETIEKKRGRECVKYWGWFASFIVVGRH